MTIEQIKQANAQAGQHYFEPSTMRFFNSRVLSYVYAGPGGVFFVTSEKFVSSDGSSPKGRKFTVRKFNPETATVDTFGPFNEMSRERALRMARIAAYYPEAALEAVEVQS